MSTPRAKYSECYVNNYLKKKKALNLLKELIYCTPVSTNPHVQKFSKCWGIKRSKLLPGSKPFNIQQQNRQTILSVSE